MTDEEIQEIRYLKLKLKKLKAKRASEKSEHVKIFNEKIDKLISATPTGDLRNELCDLNILFNLIAGS